MTISDDDRREARKWVHDATAYPTPPAVEAKHRATILALLAAAEAAATARDAALEAAAAAIRSMSNTHAAPAWNFAIDRAVIAIRSLKGAA